MNIEDFEKPPKTSEYTQKVYRGWGGKRSKSKYSIGLVILSSGGGGAETVVYELQKYLSKKGHNVTLITNEEFFSWYPPITCNKINLKHLLDPNFIIKRILGVNILPKIILKGRYFILPSLLDIYFKKEAMNIKREIIDKGIDLLHFHDPSSLKLYKHLSKLISIPSIYTFHGKNIDLPFFIRGLKHNFINVINSMDAITTVSKNMKEYLVSNGISSNIEVIYNGLDLKYISSLGNELDTKNEKCDNQLNKRQFILLFPGGMKSNKGGLILLKVMEILNLKNLPIKLYYAGITTKTFVEENKIDNVTFTGLLQHEEYLNKLNNCDCLILLSETEGFPISILEAMALGKPVITTPVGGIPEFCLNERNGVYVKRNPKDVAEKIIYLYTNPELRREISENNIQDAERFNWDNIINQYIELYQLIKNSRQNIRSYQSLKD